MALQGVLRREVRQEQLEGHEAVRGVASGAKLVAVYRQRAVVHHNEVVSMCERIHTTTPDVGFGIARHLCELHQAKHGAIPSIVRGTRDMKSAYRQLPVWEGHQRIHIICAWCPDVGAWQFAELRGLAFGISIAVLLFNRVPAHISAIARRWLALPVINFFDDFKITSVEGLHQDCWTSFKWLTDATGWVFDADKDSMMSSKGPFLGFIEDYTLIASKGIIQTTTKETFKQNLKMMLDKAIDSRVLHPGEARSLQGKVLHQSQGYDGRIGRGQSFAFAEHIKMNNLTIGQKLLNNIIFHRTLCDIAPVRKVDVLYNRRPRITIYTDASCEVEPPRTGPTVKICYLLIADTGYRSGGFATLPDEILDSFDSRDTYIAQGEALAPIFCLIHEKKVVYGASVVCYIDKMGVLASLCKGSSVVADFGCVIHALLIAMVRLNVQPWWEHVDSAANPADGGTRGSLQSAEELGIKLKHKLVPDWPRSTVKATPAEWMAWLDRYF